MVCWPFSVAVSRHGKHERCREPSRYENRLVQFNMTSGNGESPETAKVIRAQPSHYQYDADPIDIALDVDMAQGLIVLRPDEDIDNDQECEICYESLRTCRLNHSQTAETVEAPLVKSESARKIYHKECMDAWLLSEDKPTHDPRRNRLRLRVNIDRSKLEQAELKLWNHHRNSHGLEDLKAMSREELCDFTRQLWEQLQQESAMDGTTESVSIQEEGGLEKCVIKKWLISGPGGASDGHEHVVEEHNVEQESSEEEEDEDEYPY